MHTEITDLTTRVENLELNNSKKMVIITGLLMEGEKTKKDGIAFLNSFIYTNLASEVRVDDFYTLGEASPKPIVVMFKSIEDKKNVFAKKKMLKNYRSTSGRPVFVNDYLPPTTQEKKKHETDIFEEYKSRGKESEISYSRGGFCIRNTPYQKPVCAPTPTEIVNMEPEQLEKTLTGG